MPGPILITFCLNASYCPSMTDEYFGSDWLHIVAATGIFLGIQMRIYGKGSFKARSQITHTHNPKKVAKKMQYELLMD